jgi:hypothetical protein
LVCEAGAGGDEADAGDAASDVPAFAPGKATAAIPPITATAIPTRAARPRRRTVNI